MELRKKKIFPQNSSIDQIAFTVTHVGLVGFFLFQLLLVLPKYHEAFTLMYNIHLCAGLFFGLQVFSNLYYMILVDTTVHRAGLDLPYVLKPGWSYCHVCRLNAPPRSHHCPVCEVCVLKRDHHCIFTGNCIGFYNHRYFVAFATYLWLGCLYSFIFTREFYAEVLGDWDYMLFFKFLFPVLFWTLGYMSMYQLFIIVVMGVNIMAMLLFTALCFFPTIFHFKRSNTV